MSDINITVNDEIVNIDVIDTPVLVNVVNSPGQQGPAGPGVPVGGTAGQILAKASATDYDTEWINNYAKYLATNVRNQTGSTIGAFQVVYISGATGNKPLISLADADTEATSSKTYGVTATSIANNGTGDVVTAGELSGIDTSAFNEGDLLWLSTTAGGVVTTAPAEPAHAVFIGYVVRSHPTLGVIDVAIQNGYELNELHGVQITTPTDNQGLFYNSTSTLWENKSITTALGYTPVPTTRNITINGVTYDLSADRTWTIAAGISGSGASGQVTYWTGASAVSGSNNLFWDNANGRLGIGTNVPVSRLHVNNTGTLANFGTASNNGVVISTNANGTGLITAWNYDLAAPSAGSIAASAVLGFNGSPTNFFGVGIGEARSSAYDIWFQTGAANGGGYRFYKGITEMFTIYSNGNVGIGTGSTTPSVRFQVAGDTLLRGSGNTSATTALTVQNSSSTNLFTVRNDDIVSTNRGIFYNNNVNLYTGLTSDGINANSSGTNFVFLTDIANAIAINSFSFYAGNKTTTSGTTGMIGFTKANFSPTSGTAVYNGFNLAVTINQTGGANGITRGLYVNPTLTAAADFRAIETTAGNVLFGSNFFWDNTNSRLGIGTNAPASRLDISGIATANGILKINNTTTATYPVGLNILFSNISSTSIQAAAFYTGKAQSLKNGYGFNYIHVDDGSNSNKGSIAFNGADNILNWYANGNINVNSTSDLGVRFGVIGDTLLRGSGNTSSTTALTVQNSSSTNLFRIRNNGDVNFGSDAMYWDAVNSRLGIGVTSPTSKLYIQDASNATVLTLVSLRNNFNSVGTGVAIDFIPESTNFALSRIIATRQNLVNGYTSLDFQTYDGTATTTALYIAGNANRNIGILNSNPTARLDIPASVTTAASLRIRSGTAPTTPNDGDIWFDGTDIKMRIGGVTKTFTLI